MTTQAPGTTTEAPVTTTTTPVPDSGTLPAGGSFDPDAWLQQRTPQERSAIDRYVEFHKKPLESEKHGLISENGRLKKAANPEVVARLSDEEAVLGDMKAAASALYGVDAKDLEDVETIAQMKTTLKWLARSAPKVAAAKGPDPASAPQQEKDAWARYFEAQGGAVPQRTPAAEPRMSNTGGVSTVSVTSDNIDALYLEGKVTSDAYHKFLNGRGIGN